LFIHESSVADQHNTSPIAESSDAAGKPEKLRHREWGSAWLLLFAGVGGLIAGRLGQLYPHFDVFSQFGAQFAALVVAFAISLFFKRFKTLIGLALWVGLLALYSAWPHMVSTKLQAGPYQLQKGEIPLRIAHFNTFKNNSDYAAIAAEVRRLDADVVVLVEMSNAKKKAVIPALKDIYPHAYDCDGGRACDMAILSKAPIVDAEGQAMWIGPPYVRVSLGGPYKGVQVYGVHTTRFPHSRAQLTQALELVKLLETAPGHKIVMGDFNATPFSRITRTVEEGAGLMRLTELPTWPAQWQMPQLAIDHAFASPRFRVVANQQIGEAVGSDHYPILLTLAFKPDP
jgi:endonuclease/exonuclease/phosphatase (EEP) superfamily protein YafD